MDFQPFFVTCVTCTSRLRVSRKELVDNIVACPKCQSMVQLSPPPARPDDPVSTGPSVAPVAVGLGNVDSAALTEDSISRPELPFDTGSSPARASGVAEAPPVFTADPTGGTRSSTDASEARPPSATSAPPPDWHSQRNAKTRRIAMAVAILLTCTLSAAVLFVVLTRRGSETKAIDPTENLIAETDTAGPSAFDEHGPIDGSDRNAVDANDSVDVSDEPNDDRAIVDPDSVAAVDPVDPVVQEPSETTDAIEPMMPQPGTDSNDSAGLLPDSIGLPSNPLAGIPGLQGTTLEGSALEGSALEAPGTTEDVASMTELPKDLQELFQNISAIDRPQFETTEPAPKTIDEIQLDRAAKAEVDLEVILDQPEPANMRQRLGLSIAMRAAHPDGYPLNDLMLFLSQMSAVPFEIEWVSFDIVRMPINQRVKLPNDWSTLEQLIGMVCEANGAVYEPTARSVVVRPSDERLNQAVLDYLDFSDLPADQSSAVATARALLGQTEGDSGTVSVPKELGLTQLAVFVCESIRRARGVAGKMPDPIFARWAGTYQDQLLAWPELQAGVSGPQRIHAASFASLVRQAAKLNGATCYVHWVDAANRNLTPTDELMPRTGDQVTAADSMNQILQPRSLMLRAVDAEHWWIGSEASFDRFPVVVRFSDHADGFEMQQQVERVLRSAAVNEQVFASVAVDPASGQCIAIIPRYLVRQLPRMIDGQQ